MNDAQILVIHWSGTNRATGLTLNDENSKYYDEVVSNLYNLTQVEPQFGYHRDLREYCVFISIDFNDPKVAPYLNMIRKCEWMFDIRDPYQYQIQFVEPVAPAARWPVEINLHDQIMHLESPDANNNAADVLRETLRIYAQEQRQANNPIDRINDNLDPVPVPAYINIEILPPRGAPNSRSAPNDPRDVAYVQGEQYRFVGGPENVPRRNVEIRNLGLLPGRNVAPPRHTNARSQISADALNDSLPWGYGNNSNGT